MNSLHFHRFASTALLLSSSLMAQTERSTTHPQDTPAPNTGQVSPFGDMLNFAAARCQLLVHAEHLPPAGAVLQAIEFHGLANSFPAQYPVLEIRISPVPVGAVREAIFDLNLPQPTVVFQEADWMVPWQIAGWQRFPARVPYQHDGVSDLTIDIQKLAIPGFGSGTCSGLHRPDLPTMLKDSGLPSTNRHRSAVATWQVIPIDVRLIWTVAPTLRLASPRPAAHHGFAIGSNLDLVVDGSPFSLAWGELSTALLPLPIAIPGVHGLIRVVEHSIPLPMLDGNGSASLRFPIPRDRTLVGAHLHFQGFVFDTALATLLATNTTDCWIDD